MARDACARCAATDGLIDVTITDRSGGSWVLLCERCRDLIDTPRCQICGGRKAGRQKADILYFSDDPLTHLEVCDDCRGELIEAPRKVPA